MKTRFRLLKKSTIWKRIRQLNLPKATKHKLRELWHKAKALVQKIVEWLYLRREFCTSLILGVALAYLVNPLPVVGPILASLSISLAVLYGIGRQFQADMNRHFFQIIDAECA
jgi:uncharacterized membrane protein YkvA (DUF1232 family)